MNAATRTVLARVLAAAALAAGPAGCAGTPSGSEPAAGAPVQQAARRPDCPGVDADAPRCRDD
jgi:hypothetical protein